jgi:hypothetical protein
LIREAGGRIVSGVLTMDDGEAFFARDMDGKSLAFKIYRKNRFSHHEISPTTGLRLIKRKAYSGCPSQSHRYFYILHYKKRPGATILPK